MESRRHLNVRGKSATLPAITDKDWLDLKFGVEAGVDAFALSFVKVGAFTLLLTAVSTHCCCQAGCPHRWRDSTDVSFKQPSTRMCWRHLSYDAI